MSHTRRVLIVDDDPEFTNIYRDLLTQEGYEVEAATTAAEARRRIEAGEFSVAVLDQKLEGSGGPDSGLDLLSDLVALAPDVNIIVATAYPDKSALLRAFAAGAYDYLEKNPRLFDAMLPIKIRNAFELARERALARLSASPSESAERLTELKRLALAEPNRQRKGRLLEDLVALLFRGIPGFERLRTRASNRVQEIDIVIRNESPDPVWVREGAIVLVECKNQAAPVAARELLAFEGKIRRYRERCTLGFFVSLSGFTSAFRGQQAATSSERHLVVQIGPAELDHLIAASDRNEALKQMFDAAVSALVTAAR